MSDSNLLAEFRALIEEGNLDGLEERWIAAIETDDREKGPEDATAFVEAADAFLASSQKGRADVLLDLTLPLVESSVESKTLLELLRRRCLASPDDLTIRKRYCECFRGVHGATSIEAEYLKLAAVESSSDVERAFESLDRWFLYREGAYVYHPAGWGTGRIESLDPLLKQGVVNLEKKPNHRMAVEAMGSVLEPLPDDNFRVLESQGGDAIRSMLEEDPVGLVRTVLASFANPMPLKEIRAHICPKYLDSKSWSKWWNRTKKKLREDGFFRIEDRAPYRVERLERAVSYEDELLAAFREAAWPRRRALAKRALKDQGKEFPALHAAVQAELERRLVESTGPEAIEAAALLEKHLPGSSADGSPVERVLRSSQDPLAAIREVDGAEEQKLAVARLCDLAGDSWRELALELWVASNEPIRDALLDLIDRGGVAPEVAARVSSVLAGPQLGPGLFLWSVRRFLDGARGEIFAPIERLTPLELAERVLDLVDHLARRYDRDQSEQTVQLQTRGRSLVARDDYALFRKALEGIGIEDARRLHKRILSSAGLASPARVDLLEIMTRSVPDLSRPVDVPVWEQDAIYVTRAGLARREEELRHLMEETLPEVFEDIGRAAAFGDLRENAEYKAALEKRDMLTTKGEEIRAELNLVKLITPDMLKDGQVTLGSKVDLERLETGDEVSYRILGPWDGGPDQGVLNYRSPIGRYLIGSKVGDEVKVELPSGTEAYRIKRVEPGI